MAGRALTAADTNLLARLTVEAYEGADLIVPVCNYNRLWEQASGAQGLKIRPVYNGVEPEAFPPPPPEPERPSESSDVVPLTRLEVASIACKILAIWTLAQAAFFRRRRRR